MKNLYLVFYKNTTFNKKQPIFVTDDLAYAEKYVNKFNILLDKLHNFYDNFLDINIDKLSKEEFYSLSHYFYKANILDDYSLAEIETIEFRTEKIN